ncbi:MAG TPA: DsrE family protein [Dyella sp.]|nr:DsrE family protein [Dyella sp.]
MNIRHAGRSALFALAFCIAAVPVSAAAADAAATQKNGSEVTWIHPVIAKFGGVHPRPDVDMQLDPKADYKVFVDVVSADLDSDQPLPSLQRLARLVNLMGYGKVPPSHVHIVALLDGQAGAAALTDEAYRRMSKKHPANPNTALLHALKQAGVKLMVCSQAMAGLGVKDSDIDPSVTITLSGLTDPIIYGQRGYTYIQL